MTNVFEPAPSWEASEAGLASARRHLGYALRARRVKAQMTQAQAAEIAGVSQAMYSRFETGTAVIGYKPLHELAKHYECKMTELLPKRTYPSAPLDPADRSEHFVERNRRIQAGAFVGGEVPGTFRRRED